MKRAILCFTLVACLAGAAQANYFNGFETDIAGWDVFTAGYHATRVASGTSGITSATGSRLAASFFSASTPIPSKSTPISPAIPTSLPVSPNSSASTLSPTSANPTLPHPSKTSGVAGTSVFLPGFVITSTFPLAAVAPNTSPGSETFSSLS